eukprot:COSAG02_NODE_419_length_22613_cov_22.994492_15_plen_120_part_00
MSIALRSDGDGGAGCESSGRQVEPAGLSSFLVDRAAIRWGWRRGLREQREAGGACGTLFFSGWEEEWTGEVRMARGAAGCRGSAGRELAWRAGLQAGLSGGGRRVSAVLARALDCVRGA